MQTAGLRQERCCVVGPPVPPEPDAKPEVGIGERHLRRQVRQLCLGLVTVQRVPSGTHPIADRVQIGGPSRGTRSLVRGGHRAGERIHATEMIGRSRRFRRTYDAAGFVDPDALRDVDHGVEGGDAMIDIDQAPEGGIRLFNPGTGVFGAAALFGDGDDGEILGLQAVR